jgi:hypothetical protein
MKTRATRIAEEALISSPSLLMISLFSLNFQNELEPLLGRF